MLALPECHFAVFQLPQHFSVDSCLLEKRYEALAMRFHPDNFAATPQTACQVSLIAAKINDAYQVLKCPLKRAVYLLEQGGFSVNPEATVTNPSWLMTQFEWREQIAYAKASAHTADGQVKLSSLLRTFKAAEKEKISELADAFKEQPVKNPEAISATIQQLQFIRKAIGEIS